MKITEKGTIKLGDDVRDQVTGFRGIVIAITQWLNGCARMVVQPKGSDKEGKIKASETIDELQLEVVKPAHHTPNRATGGPRPGAVAMRSTKR